MPVVLSRVLGEVDDLEHVARRIARFPSQARQRISDRHVVLDTGIKSLVGTGLDENPARRQLLLLLGDYLRHRSLHAFCPLHGFLACDGSLLRRGAATLAGDKDSPAEFAAVDGGLDLRAGCGKGEHPFPGCGVCDHLSALPRRSPEHTVGLLDMALEVTDEDDLETGSLQSRLISDERVAAVPSHAVVDMNTGALTDLLLRLEEVGEGKNAAGLKNAMDLGMATRFVRHKKQRVLADGMGEAVGFVRHLRRRAMAESDVERVPPVLAGEFLLCEPDALLAKIEPLAAAAEPLAEMDQKVTAAAAHVQHRG